MCDFFNQEPRNVRKYQCRQTKDVDEKRSQFVFRNHQQNVIDYCYSLLTTIPEHKRNQRGILLYHSLGIGKTCTSIGLADMILNNFRRFAMKRAIVILPAFLRTNFVKEYCGLCGKRISYRNKVDKLFTRDFTFFAYNSSTILRHFPKNLDNSVIIIDEVHNLISGVRNGTLIKSTIYERIVEAQNTFVILLSGTPVYTSTYEIVLLLNMLQKRLTLPMDKETFQELLTQDTECRRICEKLSIQVTESGVGDYSGTNLLSRVRNYVSYVEPVYGEHYPSIKKDVFVLTNITKDQLKNYWYFQNKEGALMGLRPSSEDIRSKDPRARSMMQLSDFLEKARVNRDGLGQPETEAEYIARMEAENEANKLKLSLKYLALIRFFTRRALMCVYPYAKQVYQNQSLQVREKAGSKPERVIEDVIKRIHEGDTSLEGQDIDLDRLVADSTPIMTDQQLYVEISLNDGQNFTEHQRESSSLRMLIPEIMRDEYSPKLYELYQRVKHLEGKHVVYTPFKSSYGAYLISAFFSYNGLSNQIYHGGLSTFERDMILHEFNSVDNLQGEISKALIITDAGSEGLTIKAGRYIHIMSPFRIYNKIKQVIGRVQRIHSHDDLPLSERNVTIFRYVSAFSSPHDMLEVPMSAVFDATTKDIDYNQIWVDGSEFTEDQNVWLESLSSMRIIDEALQILREASIENNALKIQSKAEVMPEVELCPHEEVPEPMIFEEEALLREPETNPASFGSSVSSSSSASSDVSSTSSTFSVISG